MIVGLDKGIDLIANLAWRGETGAAQGFDGENGEPDLERVWLLAANRQHFRHSSTGLRALHASQTHAAPRPSALLPFERQKGQVGLVSVDATWMYAC